MSIPINAKCSTRIRESREPSDGAWRKSSTTYQHEDCTAITKVLKTLSDAYRLQEHGYCLVKHLLVTRDGDPTSHIVDPTSPVLCETALELIQAHFEEMSKQT